MAVVFDAVGTGSLTASGTATISNTPYNHTVAAGASMYVAIAVAQGGTTGVYTAHTRTVTCGGAAMTSLGGYHNNNSTAAAFVELFAIHGLTAGAKSIAVTVAKTSATYTNLKVGSISYTGSGSSTFIAGTGGTSNATTMPHTLTGATTSYLLRCCTTLLSLSSLSNNSRYLDSGETPSFGMHDVTGSASTGFTAVRAQGDDWASIGVEVKVNAITGTIGAAVKDATAALSGTVTAPVPTGTIGAAVKKATASFTGSVSTVKTETLVDTFATQDNAKWNYSAGASVVSGQLNIACNTSWYYCMSDINYDLTGSYVAVEVPSPANGAASPAETIIKLVSSANNDLDINFTSNELQCYNIVGGTPVVNVGVAYSATDHKWVRIREAAGTIYWDASPDGITWNNITSGAPGIPITSLQVILSSGAGSGSYTAVFDNFNNLPVGGPIAATAKKLTASLTGSQAAAGATGTMGGTLKKPAASLTGLQGIRIGETNTLGSTDGGANAIRSMKATLSQTATLRYLSIHWIWGQGLGRLGVYADSGGLPGTLLATTAEFVPVTGWQTQPVVTPIILTAGDYWLAFNQNDAANNFDVTVASGSYASLIYTYGALPTPFGTPSNSGTGHWSVNATLTVDPAGTVATALQHAAASWAGAMAPKGTVAAALKKALFSGTAGQTQTGIVTAALKHAVTSLTGVMQPNGSAASAMKKATASFTGAQAQVGTIGATARKASASATGAMAPKGTVGAAVAKAVAAFSGSATGAAPVTGTIAAAAKKATASLTGGQAQVGSITSAVRKTTATAAGIMQPAGMLAATVRKATASVTGGQTQTGTVTSAVRKVTASVTAAMQPKGIIAAAVAKATASLTGGQAQIGTIAAAGKHTIANLSGIEHPRGAVSATVRKTTASLTGAQAQVGTVAATLKHATASLAAAMQPKGTITAALHKITGTAQAAPPSGVITATLHKVAASIAGYMRPVGTIAAVAQHATANLAGTQRYTGTVTAVVRNVAAGLASVMLPTGSIGAAVKHVTTSVVTAHAQAGIIAVTKTHPTASITGRMLPKGIIAVTKTHPVASITGRMLPKGTISAANKHPLGAVSGSAAAAPGTIACTARKTTAGLTGTEFPRGTVAAALRKAGCSATAAHIIAAALAATLQHPTTTITGREHPRGAIAATEKPLASSSTGKHIQAGIITAGLHVTTAAAAGWVPSFGALTVMLHHTYMAAVGLGGVIDGPLTAELRPLVFAGAGIRPSTPSTHRATTIAVTDRATIIAASDRATTIAAVDRATTI